MSSTETARFERFQCDSNYMECELCHVNIPDKEWMQATPSTDEPLEGWTNKRCYPDCTQAAKDRKTRPPAQVRPGGVPPKTKTFRTTRSYNVCGTCNTLGWGTPRCDSAPTSPVAKEEEKEENGDAPAKDGESDGAEKGPTGDSKDGEDPVPSSPVAKEAKKEENGDVATKDGESGGTEKGPTRESTDGEEIQSGKLGVGAEVVKHEDVEEGHGYDTAVTTEAGERKRCPDTSPSPPRKRSRSSSQVSSAEDETSRNLAETEGWTNPPSPASPPVEQQLSGTA